MHVTIPTTVTYALDIKKGATFKNKEFLKQEGFQWDSGKKKWYRDKPVNLTFIYELMQMDIAVNGVTGEVLKELDGIYHGEMECYINDPEHYQCPKREPKKVYGDMARKAEEFGNENGGNIKMSHDDDKDDGDEDTGNVDTVSSDGLVIRSVVEDGKFEHGRYLHSRAKHGKPLDGWYLDKKTATDHSIDAIKFLIEKESTDIKAVISAVLESEYEGKKYTNLWIFACNSENVIIDRFKVRLYKKK
jgi:hypothetical protein